jgi:transcriptional regulator with XRE-family HTH domain
LSKSESHAKWFLSPYCIGTKLRSLRTEKRMTLARLAVESGLSTALLSKLETDRMIPTLPTLAAICRVYGVGLGHFFRDSTEHTLSITRDISNQGRGRTAEAVLRIPLNPAVNTRRIDACLIDMEPGMTTTDPKATAKGAMLVYILDGRLNLDMGGLRETLNTGDCAYFESDLPLAWEAAGEARCRVLAVTPSETLVRSPAIPTD